MIKFTVACSIVTLPQTEALVITLNLFDHGGRLFLSLCSRLCPLVLALHAFQRFRFHRVRV